MKYRIPQDLASSSSWKGNWGDWWSAAVQKVLVVMDNAVERAAASDRRQRHECLGGGYHADGPDVNPCPLCLWDNPPVLTTSAAMQCWDDKGLLRRA